ncbi:ABC-type branched-chain amino acid transport system, ATPase component [Hoeflea phototrophica DFL-43]|jgi:branched-chain amino acid transport system ATP-binding protein|uniref:ABC-type branched-chain amino acid transport system, ATPase component n=1 Tax=Hoeflea phototrophica (strain DSM 17068 / NCIMB 14078 / DFL-43) TaxID=411684 RepID=A9CZ18_HOEPD|nr:ABC transporter ATP-binding protein [Hoeflea phototrophica]EDQ34685.1 ABC-type branched-chain amino acid transport system, ATPase component [Hoeflea phototrophica DFL-43]
MSLLEVRGLEAFYGGSQALFGVDFAIAEGELVALMGRNGMGKTTTVRSITRMLRTTRGEIRFDGADLTVLPSFRAARLGIGLAPEGRRCFAGLTVSENLMASARPGPWTVETATALFPRLGERMGQTAATLSGGEQQMLAIARALMTNPRLLILDEATEGLAPVVRQEIWAAIARLKQGGQSILVIDKAFSELRAVADRCVILARGQSVWSGMPHQLTPEIETEMLGV